VPTGDTNSSNYGQGGSGGGSQGSGVSFNLSGRTSSSLPKPKYPGNDEGAVVVKITVDKFGNVTAAEPGGQGTTIMNQKFWEEAKQAALKAKFNPDNNAAAYQQGTITYRFVLD
jgi:TonB family protein